jgi:hypothetical protein
MIIEPRAGLSMAVEAKMGYKPSKRNQALKFGNQEDQGKGARFGRFLISAARSHI